MAVTITQDSVLSVTLTVQDKAKKGYMSFNIGQYGGVLPYTGEAAFAAYLSELADNVEAISDCRVTDINVTAHWGVTGNAAWGGSPQVERKGVFQFMTASGFPSIVTVPGLSDDALANDGINIKRTGSTFEGPLASALQAFHDKLQNGVTIGLVTYPVTDARGSDYNGLIDAYQQHRKSSRG